MSSGISNFSRRDLAWALVVGALACLAQFGLRAFFGGSGSPIPWLYFLSKISAWIPWPIVLIVGLGALKRPHAALFLGIFLTGSFLLNQFANLWAVNFVLGRAVILGLAARFSWQVRGKDAWYLFVGIVPALVLQLLQPVFASVLLIGPAWGLLTTLALYSGLIAAGNLVWEGREKPGAEPKAQKNGVHNSLLRFALIAALSALLAYLLVSREFGLLAPLILFLALGWQRRPNPEKFLGVVLLCAWFGAVAGTVNATLVVSYPPLLMQAGILIGLCIACVVAWGLEWQRTLFILAGLLPGLALTGMIHFAPGKGTFDSQELGYFVVFGIPGYYLAILLPLWIIDRLGAASKVRGLQGAGEP